MSSSYANLIFRYNQLLFLIQNNASQLGQYVTLSTIQTITALKIFTICPQSEIMPSGPLDLVNKKYVDSHTPTNVVFLEGDQRLGSGVKTFKNLPECSSPPTTSNQLVNKTYVDSLVPTPLNAVLIDGDQTLLTGTKTFTNLPQSSTIPLSPSDLVNKTYVDGTYDTITYPRQILETGTLFETPILPAGRYVVAFVYSFDFPVANKALNVTLTIANADGNLSYSPPIQYVNNYNYTLSGLVSINTSRKLYAVIEINSPMFYGLYGVFTYQSV
jgi:hypothetical protein